MIRRTGRLLGAVIAGLLVAALAGGPAAAQLPCGGPVGPACTTTSTSTTAPTAPASPPPSTSTTTTTPTPAPAPPPIPTALYDRLEPFFVGSASTHATVYAAACRALKATDRVTSALSTECRQDLKAIANSAQTRSCRGYARCRRVAESGFVIFGKELTLLRRTNAVVSAAVSDPACRAAIQNSPASVAVFAKLVHYLGLVRDAFRQRSAAIQRRADTYFKTIDFSKQRKGAGQLADFRAGCR